MPKPKLAAALSAAALLPAAFAAAAFADHHEGDDAKSGVPEEIAAWTAGGEWPMWGGDPFRNMVADTTGIDLAFQPPGNSDEGTNVAWTQRLGSQTYGNPVVAGGQVYVGTNNGGVYRPQHVGDRGVLLCFNEADGEFRGS